LQRLQQSFVLIIHIISSQVNAMRTAAVFCICRYCAYYNARGDTRTRNIEMILLPQQYSSGNDTTDADNHDHLRSLYLFMANNRKRDIGVTRYSYWNTLADEWIFFPMFYRRKLAVLKLNPFSIIIINVAYYAIETLCVSYDITKNVTTRMQEEYLF